MGGSGSTRWPWWYKKKVCVEVCLKLDVAFLNQHGYIKPGVERAGVCEWHYKGTTGSVGVRVQWHPEPVVKLAYALKGRGKFLSPVPLVPVVRFGKRTSWLFACPLCGRRVRCLYLPPKQDTFGCRVCYDLTYRKRQRHDKTADKYKKNPFLLVERSLQLQQKATELLQKLGLRG